MANTNKSVAAIVAWIHVILTLIVAGHTGTPNHLPWFGEQITGGATNREKVVALGKQGVEYFTPKWTSSYIYMSIVAYIVVAIYASKAADDEDKQHSKKGAQVYHFAMGLAIFVIVYHSSRLCILKETPLGDAAESGPKKFVDQMINFMIKIRSFIYKEILDLSLLHIYLKRN